MVTLGRSARPANLLRSEAELRAAGVGVHHVARGGDVTWHGPGQLVGYLVLDLARRGEADVSRFLRRVESCLRGALAALGLPSHVRPGMTGVFAGEPGDAPARKIASIGVGLRGWVTWHGFALNVCPDLRGFEAIVPCGLHGVVMTSVAAEGAGEPGPCLERRAQEAVEEAFLRGFAR